MDTFTSKIARLDKIFVRKTTRKIGHELVLMFWSEKTLENITFELKCTADILLANSLRCGNLYKINPILMDGQFYIDQLSPIIATINTRIIGVYNNEYIVVPDNMIKIGNECFDRQLIGANVRLTFSIPTVELISCERE